MLRRISIALVILFGLASTCSAQYVRNCPLYDTSGFADFDIGVTVIGACEFNTGKANGATITANGELSCKPLGDAGVSLYAGFGAFPTASFGANFTGSLASGNLTVTNMITPSPYSISAGLYLYDNQAGAGIPSVFGTGSNLSVTGQTSSSEPDGALGRRGVYTVSDNTVTVASETMWALQRGRPPSSIQISRGPLEQLKCQNGSTQSVSFTGVVRQIDVVPSPGVNYPMWVVLKLYSESISGRAPQGASWNNGSLIVKVPGSNNGGKGQILQ